jgi:hypothetical protein
MDPQTAVVQNGQDTPVQERNIHRRKFLMFSGAAVTAALVGVSCVKDTGMTDDDLNAVNLGSGDTGILNYAYALEQLEAAFYTQVLATPFSGMTAAESAYLTDIRDHEIAHREFFKSVLMSNAIPDLEVNFSGINFTSRDSVLTTARTFEDLGVAAYNGAGKLLTNATNLLLAGKIVSVEARHAALIRDLISNGSFADLNSLTAFGASNTNGLDGALMPLEVLPLAAPFIRTRINANNLPTN